MANPKSQSVHCLTNRTSAEGSTMGGADHTFLQDEKSIIENKTDLEYISERTETSEWQGCLGEMGETSKWDVNNFKE